MHRVKLQEIMTTDPISITPDLSVDVALETMTSNNIRRLPVVSRRGTVMGIITRFDCLLALKKDTDWFGTAATDVPDVKETMTANVVTLQSDDSVVDAAREMLNNKIGGVPIVDDGELVGIVTESDLFRFLMDRFAENGDED